MYISFWAIFRVGTVLKSVLVHYILVSVSRDSRLAFFTVYYDTRKLHTASELTANRFNPLISYIYMQPGQVIPCTSYRMSAKLGPPSLQNQTGVLGQQCFWNIGEWKRWQVTCFPSSAVGLSDNISVLFKHVHHRKNNSLTRYLD
jgi:hypothetical protein